MSSAPALEMVIDQLLDQLRAGRPQTVEQACEAYPEHADELRELYPVLISLEDIKPTPEELSETQGPPQVGLPQGIEQLDDYLLDEELGRGGMGVVYRARHQGLGRTAALKILPVCSGLEPKALERFQLEARAAARLHHTNIVPVFGVGEDQGLHYYAMQYIDGYGLDEAIAALKQEPERWRELLVDEESGSYWRAVATITLRLARALAYAHGAGVLHRDIKPANVMLDRHGVPWITDFGLAKLADAEGPTASGDVVGTLRYMAPEQLDGLADPRTDVFSLGLVLYELLVLQPARDEVERGRLIAQVELGDYRRPRRVRKDVPRDLETIALAALAHQPAQRYASADAMAEDLARWLDERPISARRVGPLERAWRWSSRNRALAGLILVACLSLCALLAVGVHSHIQTSAALEVARQEARRADLERARAEDNLRLALRAFEAVFAAAADPTAPGRFDAQQALDRPDADSEGATGSLSARVVTPETAAVLERLLVFYDRFAERNSDGAGDALLRERASAHRQVADALRRLGRHSRAELAYRRALTLERQASSGAPPATEAALMRGLGLVQLAMGQREAGREQLLASRQLLLAQLEGGDPQIRYELARTCYALASEHRRDAQGFVAYTNEAIAQLETLRKQRDSPELRFLLALVERGRRSSLWSRRGVLRAVDLLRELVEEHPQVAAYRHELSETMARAAERDLESRRSGELLRRAVTLATSLVEEHPGVPDYRALLVRNRLRQARRLDDIGESAAGRVAFRWAEVDQQRLVARYPDVAAYHVALAQIRLEIAQLELAAGAPTDAMAQLQRALSGLSDAPVEDDPGRRRVEARLLEQLTLVYASAAQAANAEERARLEADAKATAERAAELRAKIEEELRADEERRKQGRGE